MIPRRLLAAMLLIVLTAAPGQAQEGAAAGAEQGTPAAPPAPTAIAIPLAEIESRAVDAAEKIRSIDAILATHPEVESVEAGLAQQTDTVGKSLLATRSALDAQPSVNALQRLRDRWRTIAADLSAVSDALAARIEEIDGVSDEIGTLDKAWQLTREEARRQRAPAPVVRRIDRSLADIGKAQARARERRGAVLTLQSRVGEQIERVAEAEAQLQQALTELRGRLFERDRPEFWSSEFREQLRADLDRGIGENLAEDFDDLREFALRRGDRVAIHVLLLLAFIVGLRNARSAARQRVEAEPVLARAEVVFSTRSPPPS